MDMEDLYVEEKAKLAAACQRLESFEFGKGDTADRRLFEMAAHTELGEAGFTCHVHWEEVVKRTPLGDIPQNVWIPVLQDVHRIVEPTETDHDRKRHEIVTGQVDGQKGYIREDGSKREDPRRKIIT